MKNTPRLSYYLVKAGAPADSVEESMRKFYAHNDLQAGEFCVADGSCTLEQLYRALAMQSADKGDSVGVLKWLGEQRKVHDESVKSLRASISDIRDFSLRLNTGKA